MPTGIYTRVKKIKRQVVLVIGPSIAYVTLTQGKYTLIDAEDASILGSSNWSAMKSRDRFYAVMQTVGKYTAMHQLICKFICVEIDHANNNSLDNRKSNLRPATHSQNRSNAKLRSNNTSGHPGVYARKDGRFQAYINHLGKRTHLGYFDTIIEAREAYSEASILMHGEFRYKP